MAVRIFDTGSVYISGLGRELLVRSRLNGADSGHLAQEPRSQREAIEIMRGR